MTFNEESLDFSFFLKFQLHTFPQVCVHSLNPSKRYINCKIIIETKIYFLQISCTCTDIEIVDILVPLTRCKRIENIMKEGMI